MSRKTARRYTAQMPDEALLSALTATALSASSKSDFQQASILRVLDTGVRSAIGALFPAMPWIGASPVFYVFLGDARRLQRIGELRGKPVANGTLEGFFNASVDAALALQSFILAAESQGLGCCPISVIRNKIETVAPLLGLPDMVFPVAGLCVGYPADAGHVSLRLPRAITVHTDRYDDQALPALLDTYDRTRDARHALTPQQQRNTARFGAADFYGWSEDKARQAADPEGAAFPVYLRAHGFDF
jgi:nitroreductase